MQVSETDNSAADVLSQYTIVVADDDMEDCTLFAEAFTILKLPARLVIVHDGEQLLKYLHEKPLPDLVFLDLNMPGKNGFRCLLEIKDNMQLASLPVCILSTSTNAVKEEQLLQAGALLYFSKPDKFSALVQIIEQACTSSFLRADRRITGYHENTPA